MQGLWPVVRFAVLGVFGVCGCGGGGGGGSPPAGVAYSLAVVVDGLHSAEQITVTLNGGSAVTLNGSGRHTFSGTHASGSAYRVDISNVSSSASCSVPAGSGQFTANVTVDVICRDRSFRVHRIADVNARLIEESSAPRSVVQFGSRVAFAAADSAGVSRMYLTDGTPSGTVALTDGSLRTPHPLATFDGKLLFDIDVQPQGQRSLFATRGVPGDAESVASVTPHSIPVDIGGLVLFYGDEDRGLYGSELWVSDGTRAGSRMVRDIRPGPVSSAGMVDIVPLGGYGYFAADDGTGQKLWRSNGTALGTEPVTTSNLYVSNVIGVHNGQVYFVARQTDDFNSAVWQSDGSPGAETFAVDFDPDFEDNVSCLTSIGSTVYFSAWNSTAPSVSVWAAGDDLSDRREIVAVGYGCGFRALGSEVYFVTGNDDDATLWATDGTAAGTRRVAEHVVRSFPSLLLPVGDRLIFPRTTLDEGVELWSTDGNDLALVLDANPGPASGVSRLNGGIGTGEFAFFPLSDGLTGLEPWVTDGTAAGTRQLANLAQEMINGDGVLEILGYTSQGVFFAGCKAEDDCELWITDGTAAGTREVIDLGPGSTNPSDGATVNDLLVFRNTLGGPWVSDGTAAGTHLLGDSGFWRPSADTGGFLLYAGRRSPGGGSALWRTDGTAAGTSSVADINLNFSHSNLFTPFQGMTYFKAGLPRGLYRTDGTTSGTALVAPVEITHESEDPLLAAVGDASLLFTARDSAGHELWRSDGTGAGTERLADLFAGPDSGAPGAYAAFRDEVYFRARDGVNEWGLWASDGSSVRLVRPFDEPPSELVGADDVLYFNALSGLWKSDGTGPGTVPIERRSEGFAGNPIHITPFGGGVFFFAAEAHAYRPFVSDGNVIVPVTDQVRIESRAPLHVPDGPFAGIYFVGWEEASGLELWVLKPDL